MTLLTTREAAKLWGCAPDMVRYHLRAAGLTPIKGDPTMYEGRTFFWRADDVLAARAAWDAKMGQPVRPITKKEQRAANAETAARKALKRQQQLERWRAYYRARAERREAERAGRTA